MPALRGDPPEEPEWGEGCHCRSSVPEQNHFTAEESISWLGHLNMSHEGTPGGSRTPIFLTPSLRQGLGGGGSLHPPLPEGQGLFATQPPPLPPGLSRGFPVLSLCDDDRISVFAACEASCG